MEQIQLAEEELFATIGRLYMANQKLNQVVQRFEEIAEKLGVSLSYLTGSDPGMPVPEPAHGNGDSDFPDSTLPPTVSDR